MAQTPQEWFEKNLKWITILLLVLFLFKSVQSCTRSMNITATERKTTYTIDSLRKNNDILARKVELKDNELKIKNEMIESYRSQINKMDGKQITIINNIPRDTTRKK